MDEIKCISYKEASILYRLLKEIDSPDYVSRRLNMLALKETTLTNLLFNYRLLAFVENKINNPNIVLFQLPSIDETNTVEVLMLCRYESTFFEKAVEYIKKEFKEFGWRRILIEYKSRDFTDGQQDAEISKLGFLKHFTARCINENCFRNLASIMLSEV